MSQEEEEGDSDETESRADRLTDRRERSRERTRSETTESETGANTESNQTGQPGQTAQDEQTGQSTQSAQAGESEADDEGGVWSETGSENVKRENTALYMYLDQRLRDAVIDVFEDVRYHYRKAYDVELEKNRHVYPLILEYGIEPVREMSDSPAEVRDALDANPYTPVPAEVPADA